MKSILSMLAVVAILGGCASTSTTNSAAPAAKNSAPPAATTVVSEKSDDDVVCTRETRTGSHRKTRVCRTVAEARAERDDAQNTLRKAQSGGTKPIN